MNILNKFCCCVDLRRGCLIYAWFQMVPLAILTGKISYISDLIKTESPRINDLLVAGQFDLMIAIQVIKMFTSLALIWGLVKTLHMYYEPWLFINGLENIIVMIYCGFFFVFGCIFHYEIIVFICTPLAIFIAYGWYMWSRVYIVYKRDKNPDVICFKEQDHDIQITC